MPVVVLASCCGRVLLSFTTRAGTWNQWRITSTGAKGLHFVVRRVYDMRRGSQSGHFPARLSQCRWRSLLVFLLVCPPIRLCLRVCCKVPCGFYVEAKSTASPPDQFLHQSICPTLVLWLKTGGLAGFALDFNMIAICSNTSVYVGATIFPLVRSCPFPEQYKVRRSHQQEIVRRMSCCQAARICSKGLFERMTRDTTVTAPSTMKFMVVAPPDGNIFTVGAKRFR